MGDALGEAFRDRLGRGVGRAEIVDAFEPDHGGDARQAGDVPVEPRQRIGTAGERLGGAVLGGADNLVAADPLVDHDEVVAVGGVQAARQDIRPAVVAVDRGRRAVGDRIAERHDQLRLVRHQHVDLVEEVPGGRRQRERAFALAQSLRAGAGRRYVGCLERLGVPGHRSAVAGNVETDREFATAQQRIGRRSHERQHHRVADDAFAGGDGDARLALERRRPVGAGDNRAAAFLQADVGAIEGDGFGAEGVREPEAHLLSPDVGADDQAERLVLGALGGNGECKFEFRLRGRIADRVGAMGRSRPARHPLLRLQRA